MSVDVIFIKNNDRKNTRFAYSSTRQHALEFMCKVAGLPDIPFRWNVRFYPEYDVKNIFKITEDKVLFYFDHIYMPEYIDYVEIEQNLKQKRYKAYSHWMDWGLEKLLKIDCEYMMSKFNNEKNRDYFNFYFSDPEKLLELKEDIRKTLEFYKDGYHAYI